MPVVVGDNLKRLAISQYENNIFEADVNFVDQKVKEFNEVQDQLPPEDQIAGGMPKYASAAYLASDELSGAYKPSNLKHVFFPDDSYVIEAMKSAKIPNPDPRDVLGLVHKGDTKLAITGAGLNQGINDFLQTVRHEGEHVGQGKTFNQSVGSKLPLYNQAREKFISAMKTGEFGRMAGNVGDSDRELFAEISAYMIPYEREGIEFSKTPLAKAMGVKKGSALHKYIMESTVRGRDTLYEGQSERFGVTLKELMNKWRASQRR